MLLLGAAGARFNGAVRAHGLGARSLDAATLEVVQLAVGRPSQRLPPNRARGPHFLPAAGRSFLWLSSFFVVFFCEVNLGLLLFVLNPGS